MLRIVAFAVLVAGSLPTFATAQVTVAVVEDKSGAPIVGAVVSLDGLQRRVTDGFGEAQFTNVPPGDHEVAVRHLGHVALTTQVRVSAGRTIGVIVVVQPVATFLDTVKVNASRTTQGLPVGFLQRQRLGIGRFVTAGDLQREGDRAIGSVLTGRLPGVFVADVGGVPCIYSPRSMGHGEDALRSPSTRCSAGCPIRVLLDDVDVSGEIWLLKTWDIAGLEYYTPSSVPAQYRDSRAECGILLIWSKR